MAKAIALLLGIILGGHGFVGLFIEGSHLLGVFNVDLLLDLLYLGMAALLIVIGTIVPSSGLTRIVLILAGGILVLIVAAGLIDETVFGLLPTGLTLLDFFMIGASGIIAVLFGLAPSSEQPLTTSGEPLN